MLGGTFPPFFYVFGMHEMLMRAAFLWAQKSGKEIEKCLFFISVGTIGENYGSIEWFSFMIWSYINKSKEK